MYFTFVQYATILKLQIHSDYGVIIIYILFHDKSAPRLSYLREYYKRREVKMTQILLNRS